MPVCAACNAKAHARYPAGWSSCTCIEKNSYRYCMVCSDRVLMRWRSRACLNAASWPHPAMILVDIGRFTVLEITKICCPCGEYIEPYEQRFRYHPDYYNILGIFQYSDLKTSNRWAKFCIECDGLIVPSGHHEGEPDHYWPVDGTRPRFKAVLDHPGSARVDIVNPRSHIWTPPTVDDLRSIVLVVSLFSSIYARRPDVWSMLLWSAYLMLFEMAFRRHYSILTFLPAVYGILIGREFDLIFMLLTTPTLLDTFGKCFLQGWILPDWGYFYRTRCHFRLW